MASSDKVLARFSELFKAELGCYNGPPVELSVTKEPKFHKARPVPYPSQSRVEATLRQMECDWKGICCLLCCTSGVRRLKGK